MVTLANPGGQANYEGDSVSLALSATDSGSGTLHYAAFGLPAGLAISSSTGVISGTIALGAAAYGPYTVTVVANDGTYSAMQTFTWGVSSPITLTAPADQTNNEGDTVSLALSATDYGSGTLSYAAFGLPAGLQINSSTGVISGTVAAGDAANGPYSVTIMAGDGTYSATQTFNWNINSPITITAPADQTNNEGDTVSLAVSASGSGTLTYSALGLPAGLAINPSTGAISGTIALGNSGIGSFAPIIIVGNGTSIDSVSFNWYVNGAVTLTSPGDQANTVGDTVTLAIQASYSGSGTLVYAASGLPAGLGINTSTGLISGNDHGQRRFLHHDGYGRGRHCHGDAVVQLDRQRGRRRHHGDAEQPERQRRRHRVADGQRHQLGQRQPDLFRRRLAGRSQHRSGAPAPSREQWPSAMPRTARIPSS